jgi:hypothetical protein
MAEPLAVDPSRLGAAGSTLAALTFPTPPAPMTAGGSDPVSAAINATMPAIESLVTEGLPGAKAALARTGSSMAAAAELYTKADQSLGDSLKQYQFGSAATTTAGPSAADAAAPLGAIAPQIGAQLSALSPRVAATVPQLVQLAPQAGNMAQTASPIAQTISQTAQQAGQGGAAPAQLAGDTRPADANDDKDKEPPADEDAAGPGTQAAGTAPTPSAGAGRAGPQRGTTV